MVSVGLVINGCPWHLEPAEPANRITEIWGLAPLSSHRTAAVMFLSANAWLGPCERPSGPATGNLSIAGFPACMALGLVALLLVRRLACA
jgi:hypothetical protein